MKVMEPNSPGQIGGITPPKKYLLYRGLRFKDFLALLIVAGYLFAPLGIFLRGAVILVPLTVLLFFSTFTIGMGRKVPWLRFLRENHIHFNLYAIFLLFVGVNLILHRGIQFDLKSGFNFFLGYAQVFFAIFATAYLGSREKPVVLKARNIVLFLIIIQCVWSLYHIFKDPIIIRSMMRESYTQDFGYGLGDVRLFIAYAIVLPLIIKMAIIEKSRLAIIATICILGLSLLSNFGATMVIAVFGVLFTVLAMIINLNKLRSFKKVALAIITIVVVISGTLVVYYSRENIISGQYNKFILLFRNYKSGGYTEYYAVQGSRYLLIERSLTTFIANPWFGVGPQQIRGSDYSMLSGEHCSLADHLAKYGLLAGGGVYIIFMILFFGGNMYKWLDKRFERQFQAAAISCFFLIGIGGPFWENPAAWITLLLFSSEDGKRPIGLIKKRIRKNLQKRQIQITNE